MATQGIKAQDEQMPQGEALKTDSQYPSREKYWEELAIEEKLERTRELVKALTSMIDRQNRELGEFKDFVWNHAHEENGDVVVKVKKNERYKLESNYGGLAGYNAKNPTDNGKSYF